VSDNLYIFAGGGTGGHLYPGLAVAQELLRLDAGAKVVFACSNRQIDRKILDPEPYIVVPQPILPMPRSVKGWPKFFKSCVASWRQSRDMIADLQPAAVLGLGGFAAGPLVRRAARRGIATALLNPDAVPGVANKLLAASVRVIFSQFESSAAAFPPGARGKVKAVGCPVRSSLLGIDKKAALAELGLLAGPKTLVVLGGSLGAKSINGAIDALRPDFDKLAPRWQILHITGSPAGQTIENRKSPIENQAPGATAAPFAAVSSLTSRERERPEQSGLPTKDISDAGDACGTGTNHGRDAHATHGQAGRATIKLMEYCHRMELAYAAADLVLCRAGAVTVAELSALAKPAILMPYPYHKDQHQRHNAAALAGAGAAIVCDDAKDAAANAQALRKILLPLMADDARLDQMQQAATRAGKTDAAAQVARWLIGQSRR
jgi:UDP-N-acetylglucosamine--N-acetylmuramyl-(pentapeptide) pyrophosphoryl-undecaprenol N-acetylglucosamine transferase